MIFFFSVIDIHEVCEALCVFSFTCMVIITLAELFYFEISEDVLERTCGLNNT
jgi:hypothetical protein